VKRLRGPGATAPNGRFAGVEGVRAQIDELIGWIDSADAIAAAKSLLRRVGLPTDHDHVDDVLAETTFRITRRLDRLGPLEARPGVVAYARTTMGTVVSDLLRGGHTEELAPASVDGDHVRAGEPVDAPVEIDGLDDLLDELRHVLHRSMGETAWSTSAALTFVILAVDPDLSLQPGTPQPTDAGPDQRARWAGLHYAGRTDCFTDQGGAPDTACRNRRARALKTLEQTLAAAHRALIEHRAEERP